MKNKLFLFILSFTVISVAALAMNCGCAMADFSAAHHQTDRQASGHCEKQGASSHQNSHECCGGCKLQSATLNSQDLLIAPPASGTVLPDVFLSAAGFYVPEDPKTFSAGRFTSAEGLGVSTQPLYLLLQSLLI